ncbi:MAG: FG-GAP repeat protein [Actinomycetota bacterium]
MNNRRTSRATKGAIALAIGALAALLPFGAEQADAAVALFDFPCSSGSRITGDFNNDGSPDIAFGAPGDDLEQVEVDGSLTDGVTDAGSISVVYSGPENADGLNPQFRPDPTTRLFFSQNTPSVSDNAEKDDNFGFSMVAGNFNGSGGTDLAIGIPGENGSAGAIQVLYSQGAAGLAAGDPGSTAFNRVITQNSPGVEGVAEAGDLFGYAVASGDFNSDGIDDLAIGAPREDIGSRKDAGVLHII